MRPTLVVVSGAPGSGKTTLARHLSDRLRLPHLNRDAVFWGLRWTARDLSVDAVGPGVPAFHEAIATFLGSGVSLVADATLYRGVSEQDITSLVALADAINVHCRAADAVERFREREARSADRLAPIDSLVARVRTDLPRTVDPLLLDWPVIEVDTTSGYSPTLDEIVALVPPGRPRPGRDPSPTALALAAGGLGLDYGTVVLVESDERWPAAFERLARDLMACLGDAAVAIEHVGSTAVPGLISKPILDVAVGLQPATAAQVVNEVLERNGFEYRGDHGDQGGRLFALNVRPQRRVAHLHVVDYGDARWRRYLTFRDRLRDDADARERYAAAKRELALRFPDSRPSYTAGKASIVGAIVAEPPSGARRQGEPSLS